MPHIPTLLEKVEQLYKLAQETYYTPDDPEDNEPPSQNGDEGLYGKMVDAARAIRDPDVQAEVLLIAELYKTALSLNSGYNFVNKALSNVINILDDDSEDEQENVENLLNEVSKDLRDRAKASGGLAKGDNDQAIKALQQVKQSFNQQSIDEELNTPNAYEGTPEDAISNPEEGVSTFDMSGGVRGEKGDKVNRGYSTIKRTYSDWLKRFEDERDRYQDMLEDPDLNVIKTNEPSKREKERKHKEVVKRSLSSLINILNQIIPQTEQVSKLQEHLQTVPEDQQAKDQLKEARNILHQLQTERTKYKNNLRQDILDDQVEDAKQQLNTARDPRARALLEEQLKLQELMASKDRGKAKEIDARKKLIKSMVAYDKAGDPVYLTLNPELEKRLRGDIAIGENEKRAYEKIQRDYAKQRAKLKGAPVEGIDPENIPTTVQRKELGGGSSVAKYDFKVLELNQLAEHLSQRLATGRVVAKQAITHELVEGKKVHNQLKPFVDAVAEAATNKDKVAFNGAVKQLNEAVKSFAHKSVAVRSYLWNVKYSPLLYKLKDTINGMSKWINNPTLDEQQKMIVQSVVRQSKLLINHYEKNYPVSKAKIKSLQNERGWGGIYFDKAIEVLKEIATQLEPKTK